MKMKHLTIVLSTLIIALFSGCKDDGPEPDTGDPVAPTLTTLLVTKITPSDAFCGGEITSDGGADIIVRGVVYAETENPDLDDMVVQSGSGSGSYQSHMTGLKPSTKYFVRAYATNSAGTAYGNQQEFTTEDSIETNPKTFQMVRYVDKDIDVTFYDSVITSKNLYGSFDYTMDVSMSLDGYPNSELTIEIPEMNDGEYILSNESSFKVIGMTGKGFTGDNDVFQVRKTTGPFDENEEGCKLYTKDGKTVLEIINADFENPTSGNQGKLSVTLYWEDK